MELYINKGHTNYTNVFHASLFINDGLRAYRWLLFVPILAAPPAPIWLLPYDIMFAYEDKVLLLVRD